MDYLEPRLTTEQIASSGYLEIKEVYLCRRGSHTPYHNSNLSTLLIQSAIAEGKND
jgi:hypothetical protein